jgi:hypothetical protein
MTVSEWQIMVLSGILFRVALVLAGLIVAVRRSAARVIWYVHHAW